MEVAASPNDNPISLLACAILVKLSIISNTFLPWSLKYSAIAVALLAPLILINGDLSAGTATTVIFWAELSLNNSLTIVPTSLARSPIKAITTTSASVYLLIIPNNTDLPTPEPAMIPSLWPWPTVNRAFIILTPTSNGFLIKLLFRGFMTLPIRGHLFFIFPKGFSSNGFPKASVTLPSKVLSTSIYLPSSCNETSHPETICEECSNIASMLCFSLKRITSAKISLPIWSFTTQRLPIGAGKGSQ